MIVFPSTCMYNTCRPAVCKLRFSRKTGWKWKWAKRREKNEEFLFTSVSLALFLSVWVSLWWKNCSDVKLPYIIYIHAHTYLWQERVGKRIKVKKGNLVSLSTETRNLERRVAVEATKTTLVVRWLYGLSVCACKP